MSRQLGNRPYTIWQLVRSYWQSEYRVFAYIFLISVLVMTLVLVGMQVLITNWYNYFYNALQDYNKRAIIDLLVLFVLIVSIDIAIDVYRFYIQQYLGLRWRRWLTQQFMDRWLAKRSYYYLENFDKQTDNPDQRIQEDINALVTYSLDLLVGLVSSIGTIFAFIYILWTLSGTITIPLGFTSIKVEGYLVWVGIIYAVFGTFFTFKIGRPLPALNFEQQRREANFRYAAVDLRTHSEHIALYRGEHHQKKVLNNLLDYLLDNWYMIILRQKLLLWFTAGYNQVSVLVPLAVALPNYFNKVFKLGGLIQTLAAFDRIQTALSFLVNAFTKLAEWKAVAERLITFLNHMYQVDQEAAKMNKFVMNECPKNRIVAKNIDIFTPQNQPLLRNINEEFIHGKSYWLRGISGIGKSTFVRALAGIWPYGSGEISLPENKSIMFIPQKLYMPLGTLKEALLFPDKVKNLSDEDLAPLLKMVGLPELTHELHEIKPWSETLSPGELQRIAFARILIQKPDWVFLDESTSALDAENEKRVYSVLKEKLPHCSIISIGHRQSLEAYHDKQIDMEPYSIRPESVSTV